MIKEGIGLSLVVAGGAIILAQRAISALQERRGLELHTPYGVRELPLPFAAFACP